MRIGSAPADANGEWRGETSRDVGARPEPHLSSFRRQHDTGSGAAADDRALRRALRAAEEPTDDGASASANADLRGVLALRGLSQTRQGLGLQVVSCVSRVE